MGQNTTLISPPVSPARVVAVAATPPPTVKTGVKVPAIVKPEVKVPAQVPAQVQSPQTATPHRVPGAGTTRLPFPTAHAPAAVSDFDTGYATTVISDMVYEIGTSDAQFTVHPDIDMSTSLGFLSADMARLLNAGTPPVANTAHYFALVNTVARSYGTAADQVPDHVVAAATAYSAARKATTELLGLLNPVLGTKFALATWTLR
jgi:hypothetical protein